MTTNNKQPACNATQSVAGGQTTNNKASGGSCVSRNSILLVLCLFFFTVFLVEFLYEWKLEIELGTRQRKLEQSVAKQEEKVVTPAMIREDLSK